jgi:hypothetical protein
MGEAWRVPSLPSDQNPMFPKPEAASRFPRWSIAGWLLLYVEDTLGRLPMLLLGPVLGAVVGTAVAVSELATVRIGGKLVAAPPSVWDVLWPAVLGAVGGIVVLMLLAAGWGILSYFRHGDDTWEVVIEQHPSGSRGELVQLVCRGDVPADPNQLGAQEVIIQRPSGDFDRTDMFTPRPGKPYGVIATGIRSLNESGTYRIRWYATEHRGKRTHEIGRATYIEPPT